MERGQRITGLRARAIEASLAMPLILAACSGDKAPATQTPVLPTEQPTPTLVATPTATPEVTVAPTPEPTLIPISDILKGDIVKPDVKKVAEDIKAVLEANPGAVDATGQNNWEEKTYLQNWQYCQKGNPDISGDIQTNKALFCGAMIVKMYDNYKEYKDVGFYNTAKEVYDYAAKTLDKEYLDGIKEKLH